MLELPLPSAGRRFFQKFGFAFFWGSLFGALFGALAYYRAPWDGDQESPPWHTRVRLAFEALELATLDWRLQALGAASEPSDQVVAVTIDDEALASARAGTDESLARRPWPRDAVGKLVEELADEGAALAVVDMPFSDLSPHACGGDSDDAAFQRRLEGLPGRVLLTFGWSGLLPPPAERELRPVLLQVGSVRSLYETEAWQQLRRILVARAQAYAIPEGTRVQLWAGVSSEEAARALAERWGLKEPLSLRPRTASERRHEVPAWRVLAALAAVKVHGMDTLALPRARSLEVPVPWLLAEGHLFGASELQRDPDGKVRRYPHLVSFTPAEGEAFVLPSAPLAAAMRKAGTRDLRYAGGRLQVGDAFSVPVDETGRALLRWDMPEVHSSAQGTLGRQVSAWRVLVNRRDREQSRGVVHYDNALTDKVVLLSDTADAGAAERYRTPVGRIASSAVLGQAMVNLLRSQGVERADAELDLLLTVLLGFIGALLAVVFSSAFRARGGLASYAVALCGSGGLYAFWARDVLLREQRWVALAAPLLTLSCTFLASMGYAAALERRVREFVTTLLGRYVSPEVARRIERNLSLIRPQRREVTVLYARTHSFAELGERMEPRKLTSLMREYLSEVSAAVRAQQGQLDTYLGDRLVAFWGAPVRAGDHAKLACESALRSREAFAQREDRWVKRLGSVPQFRAGLHTGEAVVGEMGTDHRAHYTVTGAVVGAATQLQEWGARYGAPLLTSQVTARAAADAYVFRELDLLDKGGTLWRVFALQSRAGELRPEEEAARQTFGAALEAFRARRFSQAREAFERLAAAGDVAAKLYVERCERLNQTPPPERWEGAFDADQPLVAVAAPVVEPAAAAGGGQAPSGGG